MTPLRVLVLRRPASRAAGWQSVTGRVEPGDASLADACLREILEETGLGPPDELVDLERESSFVGYDGMTYRQRTFAAAYATPQLPTLSDEHEEARWVEPDEALALLTWADNRDGLRVLLDRLKK